MAILCPAREILIEVMAGTGFLENAEPLLDLPLRSNGVNSSMPRMTFLIHALIVLEK